MDRHSKTTLVFGAGFSRAFVPEMPLLIDDYSDFIDAKNYEVPRSVRRILNECTLQDGRINIELLMTRLDSGMPYDPAEDLQIYQVRLNEIKRALMDRLGEAKVKFQSREWKEDPDYDLRLRRLARYCVEKRITCITFNYDDLFDEALYKECGDMRIVHGPHWHPDGGYGFFCRPSYLSVVDVEAWMGVTAISLLKLHGSINWRIRRGSAKPYMTDAIVHHESWTGLPGPLPSSGFEINANAIEAHLERQPFIVPPVLIKADLLKQPILQTIWTSAFQQLRESDRVVFLGYSFPPTDLASRFLFKEALDKADMDIQVVSIERDVEVTKAAYRSIFPQIKEEQFFWGGAEDWVKAIA